MHPNNVLRSPEAPLTKQLATHLQTFDATTATQEHEARLLSQHVHPERVQQFIQLRELLILTRTSRMNDGLRNRQSQHHDIVSDILRDYVKRAEVVEACKVLHHLPLSFFTLHEQLRFCL